MLRIAEELQTSAVLGWSISSSLRHFYCARCRASVLICSACDHGDIYCDGGCAEVRRRESVTAAGKRYQSSTHGAKKHARRQARYRAARKPPAGEIVTHHGSADPAAVEEPAVASSESDAAAADDTSIEECCSFCGKPGDGFVRNEFLWRIRGTG